jgi:hypothetical protein
MRDRNAEQGHWSEQPPRFSARRVAAVRTRLVRSTVTVGGCRSVLAFGGTRHPTMNAVHQALAAGRLAQFVSQAAAAAAWAGLGAERTKRESTPNQTLEATAARPSVLDGLSCLFRFTGFPAAVPQLGRSAAPDIRP